MMHRSLLRFCHGLVPVLLALTASGLHAHEKAATDMASSANALISSLDADQKKAAVYAFDHDERKNWHFVPKERNGLSLRAMNEAQQQLALALVNAGLSDNGYRRVKNIMSLEDLLFEIESAAKPENKDAVRERRNPGKYYVSVFGTPAMEGSWGWRFEGHHLSLNYTVREGHLVRTAPHFFGSNPAEIKDGPRKGLRILAEEEDLGRVLARSMNDSQWEKCLVSEKAYPDIITGASKKAKALEPFGISDAKFSDSQREALKVLVHAHLFRMRPEIAEDRWKEILTEGPIHFAWAGSREPKQGHYYRVQGKSFLLEYDNTQNNANHVHTVWRDFDGDFGEDILIRHLEKDHGIKTTKP